MTAKPTPNYLPDDGLMTPTSVLQSITEDSLIALLPPDPSSGLLVSLKKQDHLKFIARNLLQGFSQRYAAYDASQPWLVFWTVQSLSVLGVGIDPTNKQRIIDSILTWQHPDGGFGGGPGQAAHLLATYAAVCSLAIVGDSSSNGGWEQIDRKKLYDFFMSLKQADGSFLVAHHSEVDVRGIYALLVVATLLDMLTPELVEGTAAFIAGCQTYEGGFASSSYASTYSTRRSPLGEAHGGYTSCGLASWVLLQPTIAHLSDPPTIDLDLLTRWLVQMQGHESELGGFRGRTNKLVDGCYSWWVGGGFNLLKYFGSVRDEDQSLDGIEEDVWADADDSLFNREALQEYVLLAGQQDGGGLRDKPKKSADAYHTLYCLAGLSSAQHRVSPYRERTEEVEKAWTGPTDGTPAEKLRYTAFVNALSWTEEEGMSSVVGGTTNRVNATHPIFNLTVTHTLKVMSHFYKQDIPSHIPKLTRPGRS